MSSSRVQVERPSLPLLVQRIGMRPDTIDRLQELLQATVDRPSRRPRSRCFFDVEQRAGRRILAKLKRAGVAELVDTRQNGGNGRPPQLYRVDL